MLNCGTQSRRDTDSRLESSVGCWVLSFDRSVLEGKLMDILLGSAILQPSLWPLGQVYLVTQELDLVAFMASYCIIRLEIIDDLDLDISVLFH